MTNVNELLQFWQEIVRRGLQQSGLSVIENCCPSDRSIEDLLPSQYEECYLGFEDILSE